MAGGGDERLEDLLVLQRRSWERGESASVEELISQHTWVSGSNQALLDLIQHEMQLREQHDGQPWVLDEYLERFPSLGAELRQQAEHDADLSVTVPLDAAAREKLRAPGRPISGPKQFGRYEVKRELGSGGFGTVYLGWDPELKRDVAIKVAQGSPSQDRLQMIQREARMMAKLSHDAIVAVYDVGDSAEGVFLVSEYIAGETLRERLRSGRLPAREAVELVQRVALGLHHAHEQGLLHRDIKPSNILLDEENRPHLTDFGLATLTSEKDLERLCGTPLYMAPEQLRGEQHRIGPATDGYALGAVLHESLSGSPPFRGTTLRSLMHDIANRAAPDLPDDIEGHEELQRICQRALAKRMADRHGSARELADELGAAFETLAESRAPGKLVPRGLLAFGAEDNAGFLELLPGPLDRDRLPMDVSFWKQRIESRASESAFPVGMLCGPSGSGKSSVVHAGIVPRLDSSVTVVTLEAMARGTETELATRLQAATGEPSGSVDPGADLEDFVAHCRATLTGSGRKVLVVLDQFEVWLQETGDALDESHLVAALRQFDGVHLQALALVRDDFWLPAARFFRALEIPLVEDGNLRLLDRFDRSHARRVLALLGHYHGRLALEPAHQSAAQQQFLDEVIADLAVDGRVTGLQVSLFADLVKDQEWTTETLESLGGAQGLLVAFLARSVGSGSSLTRAEKKACPPLLAALLPEPGNELRGPGVALSVLRQRCGADAELLERLLRILDRDLHIITPRVLPGAEHEVLYSLSHDQLIPAARQWVTGKRRQSWRGRALQVLDERTQLWKLDRSPRSLPGFWQTATILLAVPAARCANLQARCRAQALRHHGRRLAGVLLVTLLVAGFALMYRSRQRTEQARDRVAALLDASPAALPQALERVRPLLREALPELQRHREEPSLTTQQRLHVISALGAAHGGRPGTLVDLIPRLPVNPATCRNVVQALSRFDRQETCALLHARLRETTEPPVKARLATILLQLGDAAAVSALVAPGAAPVDRSALVHGFRDWHGDLSALLPILEGPVDDSLRAALCLSVGRIDPGELSNSSGLAWIGALQRFFLASPGAATHAAAGWALRNWEESVPALSPTAEPEPGRTWYFSPTGLTLVRVPAGRFQMSRRGPADELIVELTRDFFISDREVSVALFERFLAAPDAPEPIRAFRDARQPTDPFISPGPDHPAQNLSWVDAVSFCNWLSRQEGLDPCYRVIPGRGDASWQCDFDASGYRLPTEAEWEHACRADTFARYHFGDENFVLDEYCRTSNDRRVPTFPCGALLPNPRGLFDMHGNVWELCWNWAGPLPQGVVTDPVGPTGPLPGRRARTFKGGGVSNSRGDPTCASRGELPENVHSWNVGFRVTRTALSK